MTPCTHANDIYLYTDLQMAVRLHWERDRHVDQREWMKQSVNSWAAALTPVPTSVSSNLVRLQFTSIEYP